ncbi:MAG TPA: acetolactate decarboxylase [Verrucomicrobiae bacterium]|nr:acetolactate decarboxylase [Verrucomicrobiae bacterium]
MKIFAVRLWLPAVALALLTGCATPRNSVTQIGVIDALLAGAYDGQTACGTLLRAGDTGLGTFDRLDGEMIVLDGHLYQVRADGKVYSPVPETTTPFAVVTQFRPALSRELNGGITFREFQERVDALLPNTNVVCAFRLTGTFRQMKTRSVPAQSKPYVPLLEATRHQSVFELGSCRGTVVGFRMPDFVKGINVPGYHAHFLTADRQAGGHVLEFTLDEGTLELAVCSQIDLRLPIDGDTLKGIDFSRDRRMELDKAEK